MDKSELERLLEIAIEFIPKDAEHKDYCSVFKFGSCDCGLDEIKELKREATVIYYRMNENKYDRELN